MPDILKILLLILALIPFNFIGAFLRWKISNRNKLYKEIYSNDTYFNTTIGGFVFAICRGIYAIYFE